MPSPTASRYTRTSRVYDLYDRPMDLLGGVHRRRRRLLAKARGRVLEAGVGTGRNLDLYPDGVHVVGFDLSAGMLDQARRRVEQLGLDNVALQVGDVEELPFEDHSFDTTVATCVFCSVDDPVAGLRELARVTRPDGQVLLLEHVRPRTPGLGALADLLSLLTRRTLGFHINRDTDQNIRAAGLCVQHQHARGVWREIVADPRVAR